MIVFILLVIRLWKVTKSKNRRNKKEDNGQQKWWADLVGFHCVQVLTEEQSARKVKGIVYLNMFLLPGWEFEKKIYNILMFMNTKLPPAAD